MTERCEHIPVTPPEPAYGWCGPCQMCHEAPFCDPTEDVDDEEAR